MPNTSIGAVRSELEADGYNMQAITDAQVTTVGIEPANLVVSESLSSTGLSQERLALIERYLAAHFILSSGVDELRQADGQSNTDGSSIDFAGDRDFADYRSTSLGQKALALDTTGTLAEEGQTAPSGSSQKPNAVISAPDVRGLE